MLQRLSEGFASVASLAAVLSFVRAHGHRAVRGRGIRWPYKIILGGVSDRALFVYL